MKNSALLAVLLCLSSPAWADQTLSGPWNLLQRPVVAGCSLYLSHSGLPSDLTNLVLNADDKGNMAIVLGAEHLPKLNVSTTPVVFDFGHEQKTLNAIYGVDHYRSGDAGRLKVRGHIADFPILPALNDHSTFSIIVPEADGFQVTVHTSQTPAALLKFRQCASALHNQSGPLTVTPAR